MKKPVKIILLAVIALLLIAAVLFLLIWNGVILLNNPSREKYPVRGIDVSSYQGEIDWVLIASQDIGFAYIKATEGSSHTDKYFEDNYKNADAAGIKCGAYHFFSFESPGKTQAEHFISIVPMSDNALTPAVDLEFYGDFFKDKPDKDKVLTELSVFIEMLENHYGKKPIIYVTEESYKYFLSESREEFIIWIRNVVSAPKLGDGRQWAIWQYTNRGRLDGCGDSEGFVDLNVFNGTLDELYNLGK